METLPSLQIGQHIARYPIIQGGMGIRISGSHMAAAVANAGGVGVVSGVGLGYIPRDATSLIISATYQTDENKYLLNPFTKLNNRVNL